MSEKETYVYLDLNGKLDTNYFQNDNIFFRMIDIGKSPMVQIGNYVFEGKYEDHLGTKVFFTEDKEFDSNDNIFERQVPIHLKYFAKTAKVLKLKWVSMPLNVNRESRVNEEIMDVRFTESYATVLEKFEKAELNIKDISVKVVEGENLVENEVETDVKMELDQSETKENEVVKKNEIINLGKDMSNESIFKEFIRLPKKSNEFQKVYEMKKENLVEVSDASNYPVLKQLFLENINLDDIEITDNKFGKYVDIKKSIEDGIIPNIEDPNNLTRDQKIKLLNRDNFKNFSPPMKIAYLLVQLDEYKKFIEIDSNERDQFGRTLSDKYRLLKDLIKSLWHTVYLNKNKNQ